MTVVAIALGCNLSAKEKLDYAHVAFTVPGPSKQPVSRDQFVILVIDGPNLSCDASPIPSTDMVASVNGLLKAKGVSIIGVYIREGTKYGEVVRAIDTLRQTDAKSIGVSTAELAVGREP